MHRKKVCDATKYMVTTKSKTRTVVVITQKMCAINFMAHTQIKYLYWIVI